MPESVSERARRIREQEARDKEATTKASKNPIPSHIPATSQEMDAYRLQYKKLNELGVSIRPHLEGTGFRGSIVGTDDATLQFDGTLWQLTWTIPQSNSRLFITYNAKNPKPYKVGYSAFYRDTYIKSSGNPSSNDKTVTEKTPSWHNSSFDDNDPRRHSMDTFATAEEAKEALLNAAAITHEKFLADRKLEIRLVKAVWGTIGVAGLLGGLFWLVSSASGSELNGEGAALHSKPLTEISDHTSLSL